jgi:Ca-activated chloride channel family protein
VEDYGIMFRFASPYWLLVLTTVPAAMLFRRRVRMHPRLRLSSLSPTDGVGWSVMLSAGRLLPVLKYAALILVVIAMARPQWGTRHTRVQTSGVNIVLAVDVSESMAALDFKKDGQLVNRLEAVKGVIHRFVQQREGDRIGMVVFGTNAFTQLPLTRDYTTIAFIMERVRIGAAGRSTAIGDAIGISLKRLTDIESTSNIIILLTDGQSNAGELTPGTAAGIAARKGVKIYTIGVGTRGKAPFLVNDPLFGERLVYQQVNIDEATLKEIAAVTGGAYFRAEDTDGLASIYDTIDGLEKTDVKMTVFEEYNELYLYLLLPALFLLGGWVLMSHTRFLRVP